MEEKDLVDYLLEEIARLRSDIAVAYTKIIEARDNTTAADYAYACGGMAVIIESIAVVRLKHIYSMASQEREISRPPEAPAPVDKFHGIVVKTA